MLVSICNPTELNSTLYVVPGTEVRGQVCNLPLYMYASGLNYRRYNHDTTNPLLVIITKLTHHMKFLNLCCLSKTRSSSELKKPLSVRMHATTNCMFHHALRAAYTPTRHSTSAQGADRQ